MPITVRAPDGTLVNFPDGMSDSDITRVMRQNYPPSSAAAPKPKPKKKEEESFLSGVIPRFTGGIGTLLSDVGLAAEQYAPILARLNNAGAPGIAMAGALSRDLGKKIKTESDAYLPEASKQNLIEQQEYIRTAKPDIFSQALSVFGRAAAANPTVGPLARQFLPQTSADAAREIATVKAPLRTGRGAAEFVASQLAPTLIPMGGGKAVQLARGAFLPVAGREAAKALLAKEVGIGVATTGGVINAASAGSQAYEDVLAKGGTQEEADRAFKIAAVGAGAVSGAASRMTGLEQLAFAEKPARGGILRSAGRAVIGEAPQEFVEEGGATLATNVAKLGTAAEVPIGEDVLSSGALGAIGGATIAAPIGGLQGAFNRGEVDDGTTPPPASSRPSRPSAPPPAPPADMEALARALGPVGGKVTLNEPSGPRDYTYQGIDEDGSVVLADEDGVIYSEDPAQVQAAIKAGVAAPESGLGGMAFGMDITEDLPDVVAPPPPPPPPPPAKTVIKEYVIDDAIDADGPEPVMIVRRSDGAYIRRGDQIIDVSPMVDAGMSDEKIIAQRIGEDTTGANVRLIEDPDLAPDEATPPSPPPPTTDIGSNRPKFTVKPEPVQELVQPEPVAPPPPPPPAPTTTPPSPKMTPEDTLALKEEQDFLDRLDYDLSSMAAERAENAYEGMDPETAEEYALQIADLEAARKDALQNIASINARYIKPAAAAATEPTEDTDAELKRIMGKFHPELRDMFMLPEIESKIAEGVPFKVSDIPEALRRNLNPDDRQIVARALAENPQRLVDAARTTPFTAPDGEVIQPTPTAAPPPPPPAATKAVDNQEIERLGKEWGEAEDLYNSVYRAEQQTPENMSEKETEMFFRGHDKAWDDSQRAAANYFRAKGSIPDLKFSLSQIGTRTADEQMELNYLVNEATNDNIPGDMEGGFEIDPNDPESVARFRKALAPSSKPSKVPFRAAADFNTFGESEAAEESELPPPPPAAARAIGKTARVTIPATGEKVDVQYELQDLDNIKFAQDELQNRDRSRPASGAFITDFVKTFDPDRLVEHPETDRGAPIINKDNIILSGNGRTMGLQEIYGFHPDKVEKYKESLREQGYDIEGIERPVLVRRLMSDVNERKFVTASNEDDKAALSPPEQAAQDASDILTPGVFAKFNGGDLNAVKNDAFVSAFIAEMSTQQRKNAMDDKGKVNAQTLKRIENALLYKAYGDSSRASKIFISKAMERNDDDTKTLTNSLVDVSKDWINFQQAIEAGEIDKKYDITNKLMETIGTASDIKASGNSVAFELRSPDMVEPMDPFVREILLAFHNDDVSRILSRKAISEKLKAYTEVAAVQQAEPDMLGMSETPSARDIWKRIDKGEGAPQSDLYASIQPISPKRRREILDEGGKVPSLSRGVTKLKKLWADGKIDAKEFAYEVASYSDFIEDAKNWKRWEDLGKLKVRGPDRIRSVLLEQKRMGNLSAEEVAFAEWFILRNEWLLGDLGISVNKPSEEGRSSGFYKVLSRVMYLVKGHTNDDTTVHEIMHHLERMMPQDIRMAIKRAWAKDLDRVERLPYEGKNEKDALFFKAIRAFHNQEKVNLNGEDLSPSEAFKFATNLISDGDVDGRLYQYVNPSEFWAVNATEIMRGRYEVQGSLLGRLKNWLRELSIKIKGLFGLDSNAPIIKALDSLAKGDGKFVSDQMLEEKPGDLRDITPLDDKRADKKLSELETILNDLEKAMKDESSSLPQIARRIVGSLNRALNSLDDIADNAPAKFNDRIDDLEIKIADLKAIAGASLKPANENKLETEVQKAEREMRVARQALDKAFDDDRAYKDRRTKERKAYEKEYDQLEKVYDEAFKKWDKLYREESAAIMMALTNGTPDQMRNAVAKAQEPNDKINGEGADLQKDNRGCD